MMKHWAFTDSQGRILRVVHAPEHPGEQPNETCTELEEWTGNPPEPVGAADFLIVDGRAVWVDSRTLAQAKTDKREQINAARLTANRSGFTFAGKLISTDELSRSDIDGTNSNVVLNNAFPAGWPGAWKSEDNSFVPIPDLDTWRQFIAAMAAQGAINFGIAQQLKAQLALAQSLEQVAEIVWP